MLHLGGGGGLLPRDSSNRDLMCGFILRRRIYRLPERGSFIALKALYPVGQPMAAALLRESEEWIEGLEGGTTTKDSVYVKWWPVQFDKRHDRTLLIERFL